jgi:hypothetical protein
MKKIKTIIAFLLTAFSVAACASHLDHDSVEITNGAGGKTNFYYNSQFINSIPGGVGSIPIVYFLRVCKAENCIFKAEIERDDGKKMLGTFTLDTLRTGNIACVTPVLGTGFEFYVQDNRLYVVTRK